MNKLLALVSLSLAGLCAQTHPIQALVDAARAKSPELKDLLGKATATLQNGTAQVWGQDFLFAIASDKEAAISVDGQPAVSLAKLDGSNVQYRLLKMRTGVTHSYQFLVEGKP